MLYYHLEIYLLYSRRNRLNKKFRYMARRLIDAERLPKGLERGACLETQDQTLVCDVSVSLGLRNARIGAHENLYLKT